MNWLTAALLAPAIYAIINFSDKYLLSKRFKHYQSLPLFTATVGGLFGLIVFIVLGFPVLPFKDVSILLFIGIVTMLTQILYFKALNEEEASKIIILFQTLPLFSLLFAVVLLKQSLNSSQILPFFLIFCGAIIITTQSSRQKITISKAFFLILAYNFFWAILGILVKFMSSNISFYVILSYEGLGLGIGGILTFIFGGMFRNAFINSLKKMRPSTVSILVFNELLFVLSRSLSYFAFYLGPVALVSVLENTQVLYGIIFGALLTILFPSIIKEDITTKNLSKKIIAAVMVFAGVVLLNISQ